MKYELEPDNRNCSDDVLLNDLKLVAQRLGKSSLTREEYSQHGRFSAHTIFKRFGSWNLALEKSSLVIQNRKNIPYNELLADLQRVATILGTRSITNRKYELHGKFSGSALFDAFGSWNLALEKAGLVIQSRKNIHQDELLADLKRVASILTVQTVTGAEYVLHGKFARNTFTAKFGSWAKALTAAGLRPTGWKPKATKEKLLENMACVWESVGRQPRVSDFQPPISHFSSNAYARYFGSFRKALEAFVSAANNEEPVEVKEPSISLSPSIDATSQAETKDKDFNRGTTAASKNFQKAVVAKESRRKTPRTLGWRLRHLVLMRDGCRCQNCGRSPANEPGVKLEIDHDKPWDNGGETVLSNLRTLCQRCNGGKSNLTT
jgi:hypothetical protein